MPVFQQPQRPASPVKTKLPVTVPSNGSVNVEVEAYVATNFYNGNILSTGYLNFSWIAFKHGAPVVVDVEFEDIFGRLFGIMIEYPVPKLHISFPKPTDLLWLCCDIPNEYTRFEARVFAAEEAKDDDFIGSKTALRSSMEVLSMSKHASSSISSNISTATLRGIVWKALQEKEAGTSSGEIYDASSYFFDDSNQKFQLKVFTLIDVPRKSVYALKVVATARVENDFVSSSVGYVAVPPYGDALRDDPDLAIEATPCKSDFPPDDMKVLTDIVGDTTGPVQSRAVITPRLDFSDKPKAEPITSREASSSAAPPFDPSELVKTIQDAVRAEVEDAVRAAMQVQISRLKEFIKTTVKESFEEYGSKLSVVTPESSPPRSVTDIERVTDVDAIAAKFGEILKAETMAQTVRIEASMAATATAAAAVTLRQKASEDGANGGHKKKGFWNM
ncbi:hypothetical protein BC829DRAFT_378747 [Chytridium lagenaria]|nr:hypothetical protein BC829DRAFT_378747 [Chytridium lagenaria]